MKLHNFGAGPSCIPTEVLEKASKGVIEYSKSTGLSILELSHRSEEYKNLQDQLKSKLIKLLNIPSEYSILFMPGGGSGQFSSIPLNFLDKTSTADYLITGSWSRKAAEEATKLGYQIKVACNSKEEFGDYIGIPNETKWKLNHNASYVYYCDNETVEGIQFHSIPNVKVPLVCDMSSSLLSKPIDLSKYSLIFAGAQKNLGAAGVTIVIIKDSFINSFEGHHKYTPGVLDYKTMHKHDSGYNTPPVFNVFVTNLMLDWLLEHPSFKGDLGLIWEYNKEKAEILYQEIDKSKMFYCPVEKEVRSIMNVVFNFSDQSGADYTEKFINTTNANGLIQLKGHRSVGGFRASLYNAVTKEGCEKLRETMSKFE